MVINKVSKFIKSIKTNKEHNKPNYIKHQRVAYSAIEYRSLSELKKIKEQIFRKHKNIREELKKEGMVVIVVTIKDGEPILEDYAIR